MHAKTLFLLSLADINKLRVYFNNLFDVIITLKGDVLVVQRFKHLFLL
jgi:alpha-N-acetylglucosamine transferase